MPDGLTLLDISACVKESTVMKANGTGHQKREKNIDLIYFLRMVPMDDQQYFYPLLTSKMKYFFNITRKRKTDVEGTIALTYASNICTRDSGGLGKFHLNKDAGNSAKATSVMTEEIDRYY